METRIFTFGYGQRCPFTGKELLGHYATITAPSIEKCLDVMNAMFDGVWATDYPTVEEAGGEEYGLIEHARIVIPVPIVPEGGDGEAVSDIPTSWSDEATGLVSGGLVPNCPTCGGDHHTVEPCR